METILLVLLVAALICLGLLWRSFSSYKRSTDALRLQERESRERTYYEEREVLIRQSEIDKNEALRTQEESLEALWEARVKDARESTKKGLWAKVGGESLQKFVTWMEGFQERYVPEDVIPINNVVDYMVLVGRSSKNITKIVLAEVKSGGSTLRRDQKQVLECVRDGRVEREVWQLDTDNGKFLFMDEEGQRLYLKERRANSRKDMDEAFKLVLKAEEEGSKVVFEVQEGE